MSMDSINYGKFQLTRNFCLLGILSIKCDCFGKGAENCRLIVFLKVYRSLKAVTELMIYLKKYWVVA